MSPSGSIKSFYSHAKLMITAEYLVLKGAEALSIPLKKGQFLDVSEHEGSPSLVWKTIVNKQHWFDATFSLKEFIIANTNDFPTAGNIREILLSARNLNPAFLEKKVRYEVITELDFSTNWGLGSSSSLIVNIAAWAGVNAYDLHSMVSSGSGYDIATALSQKPLLYRLGEERHIITPVDFYPEFHENLYFAYLGKKRNSKHAVSSFNELTQKDLSHEIHDIDAITKAMVNAKDLREFRKLMRNHEKIISGILGIPPLSYKLLPDFNGDLKSLGAWGGDFIILATDMPRDYVVTWLRKKEMDIWFSYEDIALFPETKS